MFLKTSFSTLTKAPANLSSISELLSSSSFRWAVGGWSFFIAENVVLSENRSFIIEKLGGDEDVYHYVYGACSTFAVGSIFYGYRYKVKPASYSALSAPVIPKRFLAGAFLFQGVGAILASQSLPKLQIPFYLGSSSKQEIENIPTATSNNSTTNNKWKVRCPFDFSDSKSFTTGGTDSAYEPRGLDRVSRHPGLWSFGLLGLGNSFLYPHNIPQQLWFAMPIAVALIGGAHQDSRFRRGMGGNLPNDVDCKTSNIPFAAMIAGKQDGGDIQQSFVSLIEEGKGLNAVLALSAVGGWVLRRGRGAIPRFA